MCVETTARYNELVTVCRTQTKPRSDVGGRDEMVGEVPRCLTSWHPSCKQASLAHPANEAHHGGVTSGHDQTSLNHREPWMWTMLRYLSIIVPRHIYKPIHTFLLKSPPPRGLTWMQISIFPVRYTVLLPHVISPLESRIHRSSRSSYEHVDIALGYLAKLRCRCMFCVLLLRARISHNFTTSHRANELSSWHWRDQSLSLQIIYDWASLS